MDKNEIKKRYEDKLATIRLSNQVIEITRAEIKILQMQCEYSGHVYPRGSTVCKYCGYDPE